MVQDKGNNRYRILELDPYLNPFEGDIRLRMDRYEAKKKQLAGKDGRLYDFANAHMYYGIHPTEEGWVYREWAPGAEALFLMGDFNGWNRTSHPLERVGKQGEGNWEIRLEGRDALKHGSLVKVWVRSGGQEFDRIPLYIRRAVQDPVTYEFSGQVWQPEEPFRWSDQGYRVDKETPLLIYESHVGMAVERMGVGTYLEFAEQVLPKVRENGYDAVQLMAVMEHPYYASFGYQVSNFFAPSSRFGTPEELKTLIDQAHGMGIAVLLDIVHSHAAKNAREGINLFDGTDYQFFHAGAKGEHPAWGTRLFNYARPEVLHFLLSNIKYWLEEFHFDGFRFDGVTSMLYHDHGLGEAFDNYGKYFSMNSDLDAITYLQLANRLTREVREDAVTVAEDMSGMPGMALPIEDGGIGFDYRLSMGVPDFWVGTVGKLRDEQWDLDRMWHELTTRRAGEKNIGYCESHDQALVGDKTIMFWLADQEMYWHMDRGSQSLAIDRAMALHKMIRLVTCVLAGEGYLNFMGNEFGHPEWIDFPREGNNNSYQYARRQWGLRENPDLRYRFLWEFDKAMLELVRDNRLIGQDKYGYPLIKDNGGKLLCFYKEGHAFLFNFHPTAHRERLEVPLHPRFRRCSLVLNSDWERFGGFTGDGEGGGSVAYEKQKNCLACALPPRSAKVFRLEE